MTEQATGRTLPAWPNVIVAPTGALSLATELLTLTLLVVPLVGCGIALLRDVGD